MPKKPQKSLKAIFILKRPKKSKHTIRTFQDATKKYTNVKPQKPRNNILILKDENKILCSKMFQKFQVLI